MQYIKYLDRQGVFRPGMKVLDIGSSNLYAAAEQDVIEFVRKYNPDAQSAYSIAASLAAGSTYTPGVGGTNQAFVGQLFEAADFEYLAIDIADGYKTFICDMNRQQLPAQYQKRFDLVVNFGTTEHVINQLNCFKIIHDATRPGGHMFHQLPSTGYANHGYFTYTGRFFFDLAGYNEYSVKDFSYGEPGEETSLFQAVKDYSTYFPALSRYYEQQRQKGSSSRLNAAKIPDIPINILYQKPHDKAFFASVEFSTSVGELSQAVFEQDSPPPGQRWEAALADIKRQVERLEQSVTRLSDEMAQAQIKAKL